MTEASSSSVKVQPLSNVVHPASDSTSASAAGWQGSEVLGSLRRLLDTSHRVRPALSRRSTLTPTELAALEHVMGEPAGVTELARRLGVTTAAATGIVHRLEARGHVERRPHPTDRRRRAVVCTDEGRAEMLGHLMPMLAGLAALDAELGPAEREVVLRFLREAERAVARLL